MNYNFQDNNKNQSKEKGSKSIENIIKVLICFSLLQAAIAVWSTMMFFALINRPHSWILLIMIVHFCVKVTINLKILFDMNEIK